MNQVIETAITFTVIGGAIGAAIMHAMRAPYEARTESDKLISILESMVFVLLHSESGYIRRLVARNYRSIERAAKNDGLNAMESQMKQMHHEVAAWHERKDKDSGLHSRFDD